MVNQQLLAPLWQWQRCSTPVGFGHGFLSKERSDNTGAFPQTLLTWLLLIFTCSLD
jgi:hypothetical protein